MEVLLREFGLPLTLVVVYSGVIVYLFLQNQKGNARYDALQETRLKEAKEYRDTLAIPLGKQIELGQKIYDLLVNDKRGK